MIEISNLIKIYKKGTESYTALDNVSLKIEIGDYAAITGPSGAGKSTLLYSIGGLIHPDSGTVCFKGRDIYSQNSSFLNLYRKRYIGFMFQQFHLMPYLTVSENIRLNLADKSETSTINDYIERCSLKEVSKKYPSELSVGEKQRTAFIRAIISKPEILLADEPTGNLDPQNSDVLFFLIDEFHKKG